MQRVDEFRFYELGKTIRAITGLKAESDFAIYWWPLWNAREALTNLKHHAVAVHISPAVVDRVVGAISEIVPDNFAEAMRQAGESGGAPETLGAGVYELSEALKAFESVLAAACRALDTYAVSQKRGYSIPALVDRADTMLPPETTAHLHAGALLDIRTAGRCLAFNTPTAAGFHILRATERVMAMYYEHLTARRLPKRNRDWLLYLRNLAEVSSADKKIHGALDHIWGNYGNPISHPEETLTEGQAIMLFGLCLSVIEMMAEVLRTLPPSLTALEELKALTAVAEQKALEPPGDF